ncbi:MAG: molybdopterin molybdenumtransferase MoeA [Pseudomonadota bacterium]|jgi:molybdopterin molybdotransferase
MISVTEARQRLLALARPVPAEQVALTDLAGRVLAADVTARLTSPPADTSAMDGWAVRAADIVSVPVSLRRIGTAPAGAPFPGNVGPGEAVRIFTGGQVPNGADAIVLQEDCTDQGDTVLVRESVAPGRHIRRAGLDFRHGDIGLHAGRRLTARDIALAAAMNTPWLMVRRCPRVAILATGDELAMPGDPLGPGQIISSSGMALAALIRTLGGEPVDLGIARDSVESLSERLDAAAGCDLLLTTGGVSVGEHDLVRSVLTDRGLALEFWKIAMRPGKPLMVGRLGAMPVMGLPGNPVSALVCAVLFVGPLIRSLLGEAAVGPVEVPAMAGSDFAANDRREDYLRARLSRDDAGRLVATPFPVQDSSMVATLARCDGLLIRPPHAPAAPAGAPVRVIPLDTV